MSERRFRAGCGRERRGPAEEASLAYLELAYPECPTCPHRVAPDDAAPFCVWRAIDADDPWAPLAAVRPEAPS